VLRCPMEACAGPYRDNGRFYPTPGTIAVCTKRVVRCAAPPSADRASPLYGGEGGALSFSAITGKRP
jgi:hypothetical protein